MSTTSPAVGTFDSAARVTRLYDLEMSKDLDTWMDMWDESFVITFPFATNPTTVPIRGKERLREITREKFVQRVHIRLGVQALALADPLKALVYLDVSHKLADGTLVELPLLCIFTFNNAGRIVSLEEYFNEATLPTR